MLNCRSVSARPCRRCAKKISVAQLKRASNSFGRIVARLRAKVRVEDKQMRSRRGKTKLVRATLGISLLTASARTDKKVSWRDPPSAPALAG